MKKPEESWGRKSPNRCCDWWLLRSFALLSGFVIKERRCGWGGGGRRAKNKKKNHADHRKLLRTKLEKWRGEYSPLPRRRAFRPTDTRKRPCSEIQRTFPFSASHLHLSEWIICHFGGDGCEASKASLRITNTWVRRKECGSLMESHFLWFFLMIKKATWVGVGCSTFPTSVGLQRVFVLSVVLWSSLHPCSTFTTTGCSCNRVEVTRRSSFNNVIIQPQDGS